MKPLFKAIATVGCASLCAISLAACNVAGKSTLLGEPIKATSLSYSELKQDNFVAFRQEVENFACTFAASAYERSDNNNNFAVSPVSVYMALSLAAECSDGQTRAEILNALGVSYDELIENFPLLFRSLSVENKYLGKVLNLLMPTNSIWVNEGTPVNTSCIDALAENYYCYSYSADFLSDNAQANKAVRNFVKQQTNGLIDLDFNLPPETLFTLINTLYLKTIWNDNGKDLPLTVDKYDFVNSDGSVTSEKLLQGYYNSGRVYNDEKYSTFFTTTEGGYKIKFIVPNDGYTVDDIFNAETIDKVNGLTDYNTVDEENKLIYHTACIFPEYECSYDSVINAILKEKFGIVKLFSDEDCDFSNLSDEPCYCSQVRHVTKLIVDRTGIEGAAVTVLVSEGAGAPDRSYEDVYEQFIVDKAFGFILTNSNNTTIFSGVVNKI